MKIFTTSYYFSRMLFITTICMLISCKSDPVAYNFTVDAPKTDSIKQVKKINVFLETSISMQGYVNSNKAGNYVLKDILPYLIIDLDKNYKGLTTLYSVTDRPNKVANRNVFTKQLRSGEIFGGKSSPFQDVFSAVIDSISDTSISIMISDCISDLGTVNTMSEGSKVSQAIYQHLSSKKNVGVAVFQYQSDFNGTYYYDNRNTGGKNEKARPYYNTILKNRPFYIWVLGDKNLVSKLLEKDLFRDYNQSHFYNLPLTDVHAQLLMNPKKGKVSINSDKQTVMIKEASAKRPAEFVIGVSLKNKPKYYSTLFTDPSNFIIKPDYLSKEMTLTSTDLSILNEKNVDKSLIESKQLSSFLKVSTSWIDEDMDTFSISLKSVGAKWIETVHLNDDFNLPAKSLEGKTFAFKYITDGFDRYYKEEGEEPLLKLLFK